MRVHFYLADQNPHRDRSRGITEYTDGLLRELSRRPGLELEGLVSLSSYRPRGGDIALRALPFRTDHVPGRLVADHAHALAIRSSADLCHYPKGFLPLLGRPQASTRAHGRSRARTPVVGTVHDAILQFYADRYPASRSPLAFRYWLGLLARSLARFDLVLTVSEFSKRSIEAFCERHRRACPEVVVTYEGARWESAAPRAEAKRDCVVHLCSPLPHKRTDTLLEFWARLEDEQDLPPLRLIGNLSPEQSRRAAALRRLEHLPPVSEAELRRALESALALALPSEIEGFGVPALEAYYLGAPVLYVRDTAVEEVLGRGTPGGFDLDSLESFGAALEEVLDLDAAWTRSKAATLRERFSWRACAERTVAAYARVGQAPFAAPAAGDLGSQPLAATKDSPRAADARDKGV
jgi:glycosyltransferase involved in cell wall biosynthesis